MTPYPKSMRIYLKNIPAKFHADPIWNDGALGFFEERLPNKHNNNNNNNKITSDMESVPGPKGGYLCLNKTEQQELRVLWEF